LSKNFKIVLFGILFILLSFYFYTLSFPTAKALQIAKQTTQKEFGVSWQDSSFLDLGIVGLFSKTTIIHQNTQVASFDNGYYVNLGVVILGVFNNIAPSQKIIDFSVDKLILIYSPIMPKTLHIIGWGDFGELGAAIADGILSININPSKRFDEFKNSPLGSKILGDFKSTTNGLEVEYAF
jgi:hypothetical protein